MRLNSSKYIRESMVDWKNRQQVLLHNLKNRIGTAALHGKFSCLFPVAKWEPKSSFDDAVLFLLGELNKEKYKYDVCKFEFKTGVKGVLIHVSWEVSDEK